MQNLLKNNYLIIAIILLTSCSSTSAFKIYNETNGKTEILVSSDRILVKCLDLESEDDLKDRTKDGKFLFYIEMLDEENTVTSTGMDNIFDRKYCHQRKAIAENIIKVSKVVYVGGMFTLHEPRKKMNFTHNFPKHGTFHENGRHLQFIILKGDNGNCTTAVDGETCNIDIFPITKMPF